MKKKKKIDKSRLNLFIFSFNIRLILEKVLKPSTNSVRYKTDNNRTLVSFEASDYPVLFLTSLY